MCIRDRSAIAELEIADIYLELNLTNQAFDIYKRVSPVFKRLRMRAEEARSRANFGRTALKIGKLSAAKRQLNAAIKLYEAEQNNFAAAACRLELARIESDAGDQSAAAMLAASASGVLKKSENPRRRLAAEWVEAEIMLRSADRRARKKLAAFIEKAESHGQVAYVQAGLNAMGRLEMRSGRNADARSYFERSAAMVEMMRSPLPAEEFSLAFMAERIEPYRELTNLAIAEGRFRDAFIWNERSRSRSLADSMSAKGTAGPNLLATETHRHREELNRLYKLLDSAAGDTESLKRKIGAAERKLATATRRMNSISGNGHSPQAAFGKAGLEAVIGRLGSGRALVEFTLSGDEIGAFVLADGEVEFFGGIASNSEIAAAIRSLRFQFESLKYGQNVDAFTASLRKKADVLLARMYEKLVRPIRDAIGDRGLVVVPAGAIHLVPFHALKEEKRYLIEEREVVYAPSAAVWERLPNGEGNGLDNALLIAFADEKIPLVESEVAAIREMLSNAETLSGKDATFDGYLDRSGSADLIHFACHGSFRPDDPMNSSLHLADGWVT
ncbi:MAG: CHAT domain-containing protein, partial [Pyrinomonadaceae bacterium]|nr:CHAT domain-containing protein [Pyrinomonadaceae bacterium]